MATRGYEAGSRRSSGRGTYSYTGDESCPEPRYSPNYVIPYGTGLHQTASYGSSRDDMYYDDAYVYEALPLPPPPPPFAAV